MTWWVGVGALVLLALKVARDHQAYERALREERRRFEQYMDERAACATLGYVVNQARPHADGTGRGRAHELGGESSGPQDTAR